MTYIESRYLPRGTKCNLKMAGTGNKKKAARSMFNASILMKKAACSLLDEEFMEMAASEKPSHSGSYSSYIAFISKVVGLSF